MFVAAHLPNEIGELSHFESAETIGALTAGTPMEARAAEVGGRACTAPGLSRREWVNVGLLVFFSQALQILTVSALLGAFVMLFGVLTVPADIVAEWSTQSIHELARFSLWHRDVVVTSELLRVAGFLSAFSGLYFTVTMLTDVTYRQEFLDEVVGDARRAFAVRAVYLVPQP
jgi:hypothetical protein